MHIFGYLRSYAWYSICLHSLLCYMTDDITKNAFNGYLTILCKELERFCKPTCTRACTCRKENICINFCNDEFLCVCTGMNIRVDCYVHAMSNL